MVDYAFYTNRFKGEAVPLTDFPRLILRAEEFISYITCGGIVDVTDTIRFAVCAVAEKMHTDGGRDGIVSENNDGYSVTYANDLKSGLYAAAEIYLADTGLLYRGVVI